MTFSINDIREFVEGKVIPFNKPMNWTSTDVVRKVRNQILKNLRQQHHVRIKNIKVGHAGTLDPLAEGVLIVCTGKETKNIEKYQSLQKEYIAEIELGKTTPSFDLETDFDHYYPVDHIDQHFIEESLKQFTGTFKQLPPIYSAKNIKGKRAYEYARAGKEVTMKTKEVTIYEMELIEFFKPFIKLRVVCSKGTYIRSLARDIGVSLNSGGYLKSLVRSRIGDFNINNTVTLKEFEEKIKYL